MNQPTNAPANPANTSSVVNKTTTTGTDATDEYPQKDRDEEPPQPREVHLVRDAQLGFGFVAGSEKPVIVRFVKEGGPSENKLQSEDQILKINGEDVMKAPRERVIELVKSCKHSITLTVCQPHSNNSTRKSALLTAAKKAKLKSNPSRVRFAEGVVINGSPLYCPSAFESCVPFIPNLLKVFLENGQTKTFKYDSSTTVQDVLNLLQEKLSLKCGEHFSLVCEHIKPMRRNKLTLLDPKDTLAKIAARPGSHNLRCLFRVMFVPRNAFDLFEKDPISFDYLYQQCCNDVVHERFSPELKYEIALRLAALHLHQHAITINALQSGSGKVNLKLIERDCGLEPFVPFSLLESMKRKELHKLLRHFLKQNQQQFCPTGQKQMTVLQAKLHYLKIISELPSYGAKIFSTNIKDSAVESTILVSPKFGISHITSMRNSLPITLANVEDITFCDVYKDDQLCTRVELHLRGSDKLNGSLNFSLEDKEAEELILVLQGYHRVLAKYGTVFHSDKELPVQWHVSDDWMTESAPAYCGVPKVQTSHWNHNSELKRIDLSIPTPRFIQGDIETGLADKSKFYASNNSTSNSVDREAGESGENSNHQQNGIDLPSLVSMEILESHVCAQDQVKQEDIIKRVNEMHKIVADAESFLDKEQTKRCDEDHNDNDDGDDDDNDDDDVWEVNDHFKSVDSLLLAKLDGTACINATGKQQTVPPSITDVELSPCESDSDSVISPNESPCLRFSNKSSESNNLVASQALSLPGACSSSTQRTNHQNIPSFGLHRPDLFQNLVQQQHYPNEFHKNNEFHDPAENDHVYFESDIIDLTSIPPPEAPEDVLLPPSMHLSRSDIIFAASYQEDQVDSTRVVTELDNLCDTLAVIQTASETEIKFPNDIEFLPEDIDNFISYMTVPPPPSVHHQQHNQDIKNEDTSFLTTLIIPPPPRLSPTSTSTQDEVIAKFWKATDDMKKFCCTGESSPRIFKREVHSSSSAESGYDSTITTSSLSSCASEWAVFGDTASPKHSLPTVEEIDVDHLASNLVNNKGDRSESSSCEELHQVKDTECQMVSSSVEAARQSPQLSRSLSWNNLPNESQQAISTTSLRRHPKPPIPPCSPSIKERRRQLAMKANGGLPINGHSSLKMPKQRNGNAINNVINKQQNHFNGLESSSGLLKNISLQPSTAFSGSFNDTLSKNGTNEIFLQSQHDIDILLARLEEVHDNRLRSNFCPNFDEAKFNDAKNALVNESRQFVTSSKLFVKCATESSPQSIQHLLECVTLLERMYSVSESVITQMESQAQMTCLVDRLKEVAATFAYTLDTVHKLTDTLCSPTTSPYMGLLMSHATALATALSALMRTLKAMN